MKPHAEFVAAGCGEYLRRLFACTPFSGGGQWMIQVKDKQIYKDLVKLIAMCSEFG